MAMLWFVASAAYRYNDSIVSMPTRVKDARISLGLQARLC